MTQYGIRIDPNESSMWLKYKGNLCLEWLRGDSTWWKAYFGWITGSDVDLHQTDADDFPFKRWMSVTDKSASMQLFVTTSKVSFGYKKADLDLEFYPSQNSTTDDGGGPKLQSKAAYNVNNTLTVSGFLESDIWRDEQPFTNAGTGAGEGIHSYAFSLPQKIALAQEFAKRSGVQNYSENSHFTQPLLVRLNWGYNHWNFNNFMKKLMTAPISDSYLQARTAIQNKWMPNYLETWNWSTNLTKNTLLNGTMTAGAPTNNGRLPAEQTEMIFTNCVLDDLRIDMDSAAPNRAKFEARFIFDNNAQRFSIGSTQSSLSVPLLYTNTSDFATNYAEITPKTMGESTPSSYVGECASLW